MKKRPHSSDRLRYSTLSTALLVIALAVLLAFNVLADSLETRYAWRADFSFNGLTTQSETTLTLLNNLAHPVHIYALYRRGEEDGPLLELLNRYAAASPMVTWEQVDIAMNPGLISKFTAAGETASANTLIVYCPETDRWRILSENDFVTLSFNYESGTYAYAGITYEKSITTAISYVAQEKAQRAMILQGQGELDQGGTQVLADLLYQNGYEVYYFTLNNAEANLSPDDLLLILSPTRDFSQDEFAQLDRFAKQGGSALFTVDYSDPVSRMPNWSSLLRYYGFVPKDGIVVASADEPATYYSGNRIYLLPAMQSTDLTMEMISGGSTTLLMTACRAFDTPEETTDRSLIVSELLCSGTGSYLHDLSDNSLTKVLDDPTGPFTLALQARRVTADGFVSRAIALGCSTMLTSEEIYAVTDTEEFIVRTARFLSGTNVTDIDIAAKTAVRPGLSAASGPIGTVMLIMLPLAVLAAALIVLLPRRNR